MYLLQLSISNLCHPGPSEDHYYWIFSTMKFEVLSMLEGKLERERERERVIVCMFTGGLKSTIHMRQ
jgi:hypothetical protein